MEKIILNAWSGILDYNRTHMQLLLRNERGEMNEDDESENLHILFKGVFYLEMPTVSSKRIFIYEGDEDDKKYIEAKFFEQIHCYVVLTVFILEIEQKKYYIGASNIAVAKNTLFPWQTSIEAPPKY